MVQGSNVWRLPCQCMSQKWQSSNIWKITCNTHETQRWNTCTIRAQLKLQPTTPRQFRWANDFDSLSAVVLEGKVATEKTEKKVFLHIGTEKTGSTSLQFFLLNNERLLNTLGFSYYCNDEKPYFESHGHFPLAACFSPDTTDYCSEEKHRQRGEVLARSIHQTPVYE